MGGWKVSEHRLTGGSPKTDVVSWFSQGRGQGGGGGGGGGGKNRDKTRERRGKKSTEKSVTFLGFGGDLGCPKSGKTEKRGGCRHHGKGKPAEA